MKSAGSCSLIPMDSLAALTAHATAFLTSHATSLLTTHAASLLKRHAFNTEGHLSRHPHPSNDTTLPPFQLFEADGVQRAGVEEFIRCCYAKNFDAQIDAFMPRLFGLRDAYGTLCGAFGLRTACRRLFLEQYLQTDIETAIAHCCGHPVERNTVVEVGHFSGSFAGAAREMIRQLTLHLRSENFAWVTFTGTSALRNAFNRMNLNLIDIAPADIDRLPTEARHCWGNYYDHAPRVMAGEIGQGFEKLIPVHALSNEIIARKTSA